LVWINLALMTALVGYSVQWMQSTGARGNFPTEDFIAALLFSGWLVFIWRLWNALRHYARFKHVIATILASQIVVGLVILVVVAWVSVLRRGLF
jgi:hypothetical protein